LTLAEAATQAEELASAGDEKALATLRLQWDDELEMAARDPDFRVRAQAYRAIAQFRFRQKTELLRRGLEDDSPACRGSALVALESLSRDHPGVVNQVRPKLHSQPDTIRLLRGLADDDEQARELRETAAKVAEVLRKKSGAPR
jgi:HEAT repeat protein